MCHEKVSAVADRGHRPRRRRISSHAHLHRLNVGRARSSHHQPHLRARLGGAEVRECLHTQYGVRHPRRVRGGGSLDLRYGGILGLRSLPRLGVRSPCIRTQGNRRGDRWKCATDSLFGRHLRSRICLRNLQPRVCSGAGRLPSVAGPPAFSESVAAEPSVGTALKARFARRNKDPSLSSGESFFFSNIFLSAIS